MAYSSLSWQEERVPELGAGINILLTTYYVARHGRPESLRRVFSGTFSSSLACRIDVRQSWTDIGAEEHASREVGKVNPDEAQSKKKTIPTTKQHQPQQQQALGTKSYFLKIFLSFRL